MCRDRKVDCSSCEGKGGYLITLKIREAEKKLVKREIWLDGEDGEINFFNTNSAWDKELASIRNSEIGHTICSRAKNFSPCDKMKNIQQDALKISFVNGDFNLLEDLSNGIDEYLELFNRYIAKCENLQAAIDEWREGGGCLIKSASFDVVESPCIVRIEFIDKLGFVRVGYVSLASEQVFINEISQEERERRLDGIIAEAENGNAELQYAIGQMYLNREGFCGYVKEDREKSASWFLKAASLGHADAMDEIGYCYEYGRGVAEDKVLATAWYARAALAGSKEGQYHYAEMIENGRGTCKDEELASAWYLKAANQGYAIAQWRLGCRIEDGQGTEKDEELANAWKERAKANGYDPSGW